MQRKQYLTKAGQVQFKPVVENYDDLEDNGWCLACGTDVTGGIEPDARRYKCEGCGEMKVYGMQELVLMNLVVLGEGFDD